MFLKDMTLMAAKDRNFLFNTMQCNAMQCNAMQCNAMQWNGVQFKTNLDLNIEGALCCNLLTYLLHPLRLSGERNAVITNGNDSVARTM